MQPHWIEIWESTLDMRPLEQHVSDPYVGAISSFSGIVRNHNLGKEVLYLEYECYQPMALKEMQAIADHAQAHWDLHRIAICHRVGRLEIGEAAVLIAVSAAHRKASLEALTYTIDTLKATVPIWKKEYWADGSMWLENCCG